MRQLLNRTKQYGSSHPQAIATTVLMLLVASVFMKVCGHEFIINWDDGVYVADNVDIRGISLHNLMRIFTTSYMGNYAPLHLFSYMLENSLWGLKPATLLITNVALHYASTVLFYRLLVRYGLTVPQAFVAAAIFAIHPVQVESVAWISQRKNTLSMLFFLFSWHSWLSWQECLVPKKRILWYLASLLTFTMALMTKSVAVVLPLFLATHLLAFESRPRISKKVLLLLPYIALAGGCFVAALFSQAQEGGGRMPYLGGSLAITMMNMLPVFSRYLTLLICPIGLSAIYNSAIKSVPDLTIVLSGTVFVLFIVAWLRLWHHHRSHFFWLTLFMIGLLPVSNIIPIVAMMP